MSGNVADENPSNLGGGIPGGQPKGGLLGGGGGSSGGSGMTGSSARGRDRFQLRKGFGNLSLTIGDGDGLSADIASGFTPITPFRAAMNAGDVLASRNKIPFVSPGLRTRPANQVNNVRRASNAGIKTLSGPVRSKSLPDVVDSILNLTAQGSLWSGNQTYVYDSSDYIRFKKLQAKNRNYNDKSFGGDQNFASQVVLGRVRH